MMRIMLVVSWSHRRLRCYFSTTVPYTV